MKLDFSEYHPLDHSLRRCRGYYGGRRTHLSYWWMYFGKSALRSRVHCRIKLHRTTLAFCREGKGQQVSTKAFCIDCQAPATKAQYKAALITARNNGFLERGRRFAEGSMDDGL